VEEAPLEPAPPAARPVQPRARAWRGLAASFRFAWDGVVETAVRQRNMRIHLLLALWVALLGSAVALTTAERLALLLCVFLVLAAEVANSALEALVDLVTRERHELARIAKDAGAGAVLILAAGSVAVAAVVLLRAGPVLLAAGEALGRLAAIGLPLSALALALLLPFPRRRALDTLLSAAGVALLVALAARTASPSFTATAALLFAIAAATAFRRRRS
jgi:diacylglycerol kinase (ATP)